MENINYIEICDVREKIARLEERLVAADRALILAESKVSRTALISVITIIIAVLALAIQFIKH